AAGARSSKPAAAASPPAAAAEPTPRPAATDEKSRAQAAKVLERAVEAQGGLEALRKIKDFRMTGTAVRGGNPDAGWDRGGLWRAPESWKQFLRVKKPKPAEIGCGWDAGKGWAVGGGEITDDGEARGKLEVFNTARVDRIQGKVASGDLELFDWGEKIEGG